MWLSTLTTTSFYHLITTLFLSNLPYQLKLPSIILLHLFLISIKPIIMVLIIFCQPLTIATVCERLPDVNSIWSFIRNNILDGMNTFIPKITIQPNQSPKWFTPDIRHQIKCLRTLRRKHKLHPTEHTTARLNSAEVNLENSIKQAKTNFEANLINNFAFNNESKIYKYIKSLNKSDSIPLTVFFQENVATRDMDKANLFNQFFFSIFTPNLGSLPSYDELPT